MKKKQCRNVGALAMSLTSPLMALAQASDPVSLQKVEVLGRAALPSLIQLTEDVQAAPASVTVLGRKELDQKTINTYGDIFRGITGVSVAEYGQGLVAYELKFRGFTSGHGRDVAVSLDGMPLNVTGSQHTNGYMDLAQLIPELLDRVEIVRGPFSTYVGNHAVAGSVQLYTGRGMPSSIKASIDNFGRLRVLPIFSADIASGNLLLALDATKGSSYAEQSDLKRLNLFSRYVVPLGAGTAAIRFQAYGANAQAPGYLDAAGVESGRVDPRAYLSQGIGDEKQQQNLVLSYRSDDAEGRSGWASGWLGSLYAVNDRRKRFGNFDISLPAHSTAPLGGEQDKLKQIGFDARKTSSLMLGTLPSQLSLGLQYNHEHIDALHFNADPQRNPIPPSPSKPDTVGVDRSVLTKTQSLYGQWQIQPMPTLKLTAGLRWDHLDFDLNLHPDDDTYAPALALGLGSHITSSASQLSPKLGAGLQVFDNGVWMADLYANVARGLKSPYAFSDFYANVAGNSSTVPALTISSLRSAELGAQGGSKDGGMRWRIGVWDTRQDKEADRNAAGFLESFVKTSRRGWDLEASIQVGPSTRLYGNYSAVRARSLTAPTGADFLSNVPEWTAALGLSTLVTQGPHQVELTLDDSISGPQPLTADNAARGTRYQRFSARAAYSHQEIKGLSAFVSLLVFDKPFEEPRFDFGGGSFGVSPRPRWQTTVGAQMAF